MEYLKNVKREFSKVVWPGKDELGTDTVTVIIICAAFAALFWAADTGVLAGLRSILGISL